MQGSDGNFYGTTYYGGVNGPDLGTVFKITPSGTLTTLYSFAFIDGWDPLAALVQGSDGNFYGTTVDGGQYEFGNVFKITPSGTLTILYSFAGSDGAQPRGFSARQRRQLLRDRHWAGIWRGYGLQNHAQRHPDHPLHLRR